jgi:redox-sensitive bicupin YhaK (pirin superfamily)
LYATILEAGSSIEHTLPDKRYAWIQVARGNLNVNGHELKQGDGAAVSNEHQLRLASDDEAELLLFDLA